jgi:hypothetical protein
VDGLNNIIQYGDVRELQQIGGHTLFTCNPKHEDEANWLAGCLLLPRAPLLPEAFAGSDFALCFRERG